LPHLQGPAGNPTRAGAPVDVYGVKTGVTQPASEQTSLYCAKPTKATGPLPLKAAQNTEVVPVLASNPRNVTTGTGVIASGRQRDVKGIESKGPAAASPSQPRNALGFALASCKPKATAAVDASKPAKSRQDGMDSSQKGLSPQTVKHERPKVVERILAHKGQGENTEYLVKWVGYGFNRNQYLKEEALREHTDKLEEYRKREREARANWKPMPPATRLRPPGSRVTLSHIPRAV
jgi:hypothetical protein